MSNINCAKCGEPWEKYAVDTGDLGNRKDVARFYAGEGCPSCGFGTTCTQCDGTGKEAASSWDKSRCRSCWGNSRILIRRLVGSPNWETNWRPNVRVVPSPDFFNNKTEIHRCLEGHFEERWAWCDQCSKEEYLPCEWCNGTGELVIEDPEEVAFEAMRSECSASDEDFYDILERRGF